jgi:hypothetical protein
VWYCCETIVGVGDGYVFRYEENAASHQAAKWCVLNRKVGSVQNLETSNGQTPEARGRTDAVCLKWGISHALGNDRQLFTEK